MRDNNNKNSYLLNRLQLLSFNTKIQIRFLFIHTQYYASQRNKYCKRLSQQSRLDYNF